MNLPEQGRRNTQSGLMNNLAEKVEQIQSYKNDMNINEAPKTVVVADDISLHRQKEILSEMPLDRIPENKTACEQ